MLFELITIGLPIVVIFLCYQTYKKEQQKKLELLAKKRLKQERKKEFLSYWTSIIETDDFQRLYKYFKQFGGLRLFSVESNWRGDKVYLFQTYSKLLPIIRLTFYGEIGTWEIYEVKFRNTRIYFERDCRNVPLFDELSVYEAIKPHEYIKLIKKRDFNCSTKTYGKPRLYGHIRFRSMGSYKLGEFMSIYPLHELFDLIQESTKDFITRSIPE